LIVNAIQRIYLKINWEKSKGKYVPKAFGEGIIIPIPKDKSECNLKNTKNYRGITISCILSKIFELGLMHYLKHFF